jgi:hypothetical protein
MKISAQTVLVIVFVLNLFLAGLGLLDSLITSSTESEMMTRMPAEWRYRMSREPLSVTSEGVKADSAVVANASRNEK